MAEDWSLRPVLDDLMIVDKRLQRLRLGDHMTWAQRELIDEVDRQMRAKRPVRIIVLKARQMGISTAVEAVQFAGCFLWPGMQGLVLSHENKSAEALLRMTHHYWDSWKYRHRFEPKWVSRNTMAWADTGSQLQIATAGNTDGGRSRTLHFLHASEVGFWPDAETLMTGMNQAVPTTPRTFIFLESTANGIGNYFHRTWEAAEAGDVDYVPLFFAWHKHPEYRASEIGVPLKPLGHLDEEERVIARVLRGDGMSDDDVTDRLWWRRWAIPNLCQGDRLKFAQEYPAHPEEAFVSTGRNVFSAKALAQAYEKVDPDVGRLVRGRGGRVEFVEDPDGPLSVYVYPGPPGPHAYCVAGDPTVSLRGDFAVGQVLNMRTWEQCATWRGRAETLEFGDQLGMLSEFYNDALIAPERNKSGEGVIARLQSRGYTHRLFRHRKTGNIKGQMAETWGFSSNAQTKPDAIARLRHAVESINEYGQPLITLHDAKTYTEMRNYVHLDGDRFGNSSDEDHDDTVMALAICLYAVNQEAQYELGVSPLGPEAPQVYAAKQRAAKHYQLDGQLHPIPTAAPDWLDLDRQDDDHDMFIPTE